jgi:hypothetical protein
MDSVDTGHCAGHLEGIPERVDDFDTGRVGN